MNLNLWAKLTYILMWIPTLFGGLSFVPRAVGTPRNFLFLSLALFLGGLTQKSFREEIGSYFNGSRADVSVGRYQKWVWAILVLSIFLFCKVTVLNTLGFKLVDIDFSYFDLMIGNFVRGKGWNSAACECNHMGVHSTYIFYLLAPIHWLINSPLSLQLIHALSLTLSLIPLRKILEHYKLRYDYILPLLFAFINYSPFTNILNYNFHNEVMYVPFFLGMLYFYLKNRWGLVHLFALLAITIKEDAGFHLFGFALAIAFEKRNWKHSSLMALYSLAITVFSLKVFIPYYRGEAQYALVGSASLYGSSIGEVLVGMLKDPVGVLKLIVTGKWWKYQIPFVGLPLLSPGFYLSMGPYVLIHSTAASDIMRNLMLYSPSPYLPFLIYYYFKGLFALKNEKLKKGILFFTISFCALVGGGKIRLEPVQKETLRYREIIRSMNLRDKRICTQGSIMPQLGYLSQLTSLRRCDLSQTYDFVFLSKGFSAYPDGKEKVTRIINTLLEDQRYFVKEQIGAHYVFELKK